MTTQDFNAAILALEIQLKHQEELLDQSFAKNEILAKAKVIFLKLKELSKHLDELKRLKKLSDD